MADDKPTTRDLAGAGGRQETIDETAPADEPLARDRAESDAAAPGPEQAESAADEREPLLPTEESERFTVRWREIQTGFVDEPRESVAQADSLVADLMQRLAAGFSEERERLEAQWARGDDVSTEELRIALTRYRSFFDRLLSA
jgi:hypothetical protein